MSKLFKYFRGYYLKAGVAPFFKLAETLLELLIPGIVAALIDSGVGAADASVVWRKCGLMVLIGFSGLVLSACSQWFSANAAVGFSCALREDVFAHVLRMTRSGADSTGTSALLTRLTADIDRLQNGVNLTLRLLLRSPFVVFGAVVMALTVDLKTGLWFVAAVPVLAAVIFTIILGGIPKQNEVGRKLDRLTGAVRESIRGVRVIRAFRGEDRKSAEFDALNSDHERSSYRAGMFSALLNPLTFAAVNILVILVIRSGAAGVREGRLSTGSLIALYNYTAMILTELVKLADLSLRITKSYSCAKRIVTVLETETDIQSDMPVPEKKPGAPALSFKCAGFRYPDASADALEPLSFSVMPGKTLGVIGGTGSGKSTLLKLAEGYYAPTSGDIEVFGTSIREYSLKDLRGLISAVPQKAQLFSGTVAGNIRWGKPDATDAEVTEALRAAGALDFVLKKDGGIDCAVEQGGSNFSGGQRQRLTIARALVSKPAILILDDSFSALDYATEKHVREGIMSLESRPAVIIISQRPAAVAACDSILVLEDGRCAGLGTHGELLRSSSVYREICDCISDRSGVSSMHDGKAVRV